MLDGREAGHPAEVLPGDAWIIVLSDPLPEDDAHSIVAHEIAHACRGDDRLGLYDAAGGVAIEEAAARMAAEWGFSGLGTDEDYVTADARQVEALNRALRDERKGHDR